MRKSGLIGRQMCKLKYQVAIKVYTRLRTSIKQRKINSPGGVRKSFREKEMINLGLKDKYKFAK